MQKGLVTSGLFLLDYIWPAWMVAKYYGARMSRSEAGKITSERAENFIDNEYQFWTAGSDVVIDGMGHAGDSIYGNDSCAANDRYTTT